MRILSYLFLILLIQTTAFAQVTPGNGGPQNSGGWADGVDTPAFANGEIRDAYCDIIDLMEGNFGGMLMVVAGIIAFATAAFGDFKHAITAVVVGISSFAIHAMTSLYFGQLCGAGGNAGGGEAQVNRVNLETNITRAAQIDLSEPGSNQDPFDF